MTVTRTPQITVASAAPISPQEGDLWWNTTNGVEFIFYNDGNTTQWVTTQPVKYINLAEARGPAGGDLSGLYPDPTIRTSVNLAGFPTAATRPLGDAGQFIANTDFVHQAIVAAGQFPALNTVVFVNSIAELKALTSRPMVVYTTGYISAGDTLGTGPPWYWTAASTTVADDYMVVQPTNQTGAGRYVRRFQSGFSPLLKWSGAGLGLLDPVSGLREDSTFMRRAIAFGGYIDCSGGTYVIRNCNIPIGSGCLGIFSNGSGTFVPPSFGTFADSTVTSNRLEGFLVHRMNFKCPIVTDPNSHPINSRAFWCSSSGSPGQYMTNVTVSDCYFEGYGNAAVFGGNYKFLRFQRNTCTGQWNDAVSGPNAYDSCFIDDNTFLNGGYANASEAGSGCIRTGGASDGSYAGRLSVCRNHIKGWYNWDLGDGTVVGQSMIDSFAFNATVVNIDDNVIEDSGGSIEFKSGEATNRTSSFNASITGTTLTITGTVTGTISVGQFVAAVAIGQGSIAAGPIISNTKIVSGSGLSWVVDKSQTVAFGGMASYTPGPTGLQYKFFSISGNMIKLQGSASPGHPKPANSAITAFYTGEVLAPKMAKMKIEGNWFGCIEKPLDRQGIGGIYVSGFDNVSILNNTIIDTNVGIQIEGPRTANLAGCSEITIGGNNVDVTEIAVYAPMAGMDGFYLNNNPLLKGGRYGVFMGQTGAVTSVDGVTPIPQRNITNFTVNHNRIHGDIVGMECRFCQHGEIKGNTISGVQQGLLFSTGMSNDDVLIETNHILTKNLAAPNLKVLLPTCTNVGAGLTDGTRTFTVTNGTLGPDNRPAIFQFKVVGGQISGTYIQVVDYGHYQVLPTNPVTVTVDVGVVGGAVFNLTAMLALQPCYMSTSHTNILLQKNTITTPDQATQAVINFEPSMVYLADNVRGSLGQDGVFSDPNGNWAGTVGDVFYCGDITLGIRKWDCVVSGNATSAKWQPVFPVTTPVVKSADFTMGPLESTIRCNKTGSNLVVTLPNAAQYIGRQLDFVQYIPGFQVLSASNNVDNLTGGTNNIIVASTAGGGFATLKSDGTNWVLLGHG